MSIQRKHIGRIPVYFGDWKDSSTYQAKNRVTLEGSEFESKIDNNIGNRPVRYNPSTQVITYDEVHWYIISNGSYAYYAQERMNAIDSSIVELRNAIADLDESVDYRIDVLEERVDSSFDNVQDYINEIWAVGSDQTITISPSVIYANRSSSITITSKITIPYNKAEIISNKILDGTTVIKQTTTNTCSSTFNVTLEQGTKQYSSNIDISGREIIKSASLHVEYPVKYGSGTNYQSADQTASARTSPAGTYTVNVKNNRDYVFFVVPSTMAVIKKATVNGFDMPFEEPGTVTIDGVSYKSYQSVYTYDKGQLIVVISV